MKRRRKHFIHPDTLAILKQIFKGFAAIAMVVLLIVGIWHGTRIHALTIDKINVTGGETIPHSIVKDMAHSQLEGTYFGLIPKVFAWLYPKSDIHSALQEIERVHNVSIVRNDGKTLSITFDEHVPHALWCASVDSDNCLLIDEQGTAFTDAPVLNGGSFLRLITIDKEMQMNEQVATNEQFKALLELVDLLQAQQWFVSKVEIDSAGDAFLHLTKGGELKVVIDRPPSETIDNLLVVLASNEFSHIESGNFSYIDLRFGDKVFVMEEDIEVDIKTTASTSEAEFVE